MRCSLLLFLFLIGTTVEPHAADFASAPAEELLRVYGQLRQLAPGDQWAVAENVVLKRDAATFALQDGRLYFAAPVEGRVLGAVFVGRGTFTLEPPTPTAQRQIARFTKSPRLEDAFTEALFFFTDDSWAELQKLVMVQSGGVDTNPGTKLASSQKKYAEDFNDWIDNQRKGNFTMRNLAARMLADLTDPTSRGFFLADFKGERYGDLMFHISWNRDGLLLPGFSNDEEVFLLHYNPGDYFEWWAGFHLKDEYASNPRPEHRTLLAQCRQERIETQVGKDKELAAVADMEFEVPAASARLLALNLANVLRISAIEDPEGNKLSFIQEDRKLDSDPWVVLSEPAQPGRVYKMRITYAEDSTHDTHVIFQRGPGLYYVTERTSWYPSFGAFDDRTKFSLRFHSPKKFSFIATGRRLKAEKGKEYLETEWESEIPYSVVGFNYGEFVEKSLSDPSFTVTAYAGKDIPDELQGLRAAIDTAELAGGVDGPRNLAGQLGIMTGGFNTSRMVGAAAAVSFQAMKLFEHYFGSLPFKTISVTQQPVRGYGQSWPTLIFLPYDSLLDSTTRHRLRLQDSPEAREFYNLVAVHEMAHQWWGHLVGWKTYHDQWLSEGIAEFSSFLYLKHFEPNKRKSYWGLKRKWLLSKNPEGNRPVEVGPLWLNYQLNTYREPSVSQQLIYLKGAYVMEMLRMMMEDPKLQNPDARFIAMMRDFATTYAGKNVSTEDFRRIVEKHLREPMDWFFNQWVYGTETPEYDFRYQLNDAGDGKTILRMTLTQSGVSDTFRMRLPIYAHVGGQPRRFGVVTVVGNQPVATEVQLTFRPEKVTLDEFQSVLCTIRQ